MSINSVSPYYIQPQYQLNQVSNFQNTATNTISQTSLVDTVEKSKAKDGKDDGKIGFFEGVGNFFKGAVDTVKNTVVGILTDPKKLLLTAGAVALSIACPPAGVALAVAGGVMGTVTVGKGIYKACTATTDAEAEAAFQEMGGGTLQVGLSIAGAKGGLKAMSASGKSSNVLNVAKGGGDVAKVSNLLKHPVEFAKAVGKDVSTDFSATKLGTNIKNSGLKTGVKETFDDWKGGSDVKLTEAVKSKYSDIKGTGQEVKVAKAEAKYAEALDKLDEVKTGTHTPKELKAAYEKVTNAKTKLEATQEALSNDKGGLYTGAKTKLTDATKIYSDAAKTRAAQELDNMSLEGTTLPKTIKSASIDSIKAFIEKNQGKLKTADLKALGNIMRLKMVQQGGKIATASMLGTEFAQAGSILADTQTGPAEYLAQNATTPTTDYAYQPTANNPYSYGQLSPLSFNDSTEMWV